MATKLRKFIPFLKITEHSFSRKASQQLNVCFISLSRSLVKTNYVAYRCYKTFPRLLLREKTSTQNHKKDCNKLKQKPVDSKSTNHGIQNDRQTTRGVLPPSIQERFIVFRDEEASEILDVQEEISLQKQREIDNEEEHFSIYQQKIDKLADLHLTRGVKGVFDLEELVDVLRQEKAKDICVITVPEDLHYTDYLVLVTAISARHLKALTEFICKLYKKKKNVADAFVNIEGKDSKDWKILDMQNIVLHIFLEETRHTYDLESLWTLGNQYDDLTRRPVVDVYDTIISRVKCLEDMKPFNEIKK